jgi:hypothetical protein
VAGVIVPYVAIVQNIPELTQYIGFWLQGTAPLAAMHELWSLAYASLIFIIATIVSCIIHRRAQGLLREIQD